MTEPLAPVVVSAEANPPADPAATPPTPEAIPGLGDAGKAAIDRMKAERDQALAERATTAAQLKEFQDRDLSELEKITRDRDAATAERDTLRAVSIRQEVALELGVPANLLGRLQGSTKEELAADATSLMALLNVPPVAPIPQPITGQGARPISPASAEEAEYEQYFPPTTRK